MLVLDQKEKNNIRRKEAEPIQSEYCRFSMKMIPREKINQH